MGYSKAHYFFVYLSLNVNKLEMKQPGKKKRKKAETNPFVGVAKSVLPKGKTEAIIKAVESTVKSSAKSNPFTAIAIKLSKNRR